MKLRSLFLALLLVGMATNGFSMDEVKLVPDMNPSDPRYAYEYSVLKRALEATVDSDGPYTMSYCATSMRRQRALYELVETEAINVHIAATRKEWESKTIPIRIPVLKGLLGYRLFIVNKENLRDFEQVHDVESLKKREAGLDSQWTTTKVLKSQGFNVTTSMGYKALFRMLDANRFSYFPRGINEIYTEMELHEKEFPNLRIEPTLALYFPTPSYFFVSPKRPELADRIRRGLETLVRTGTLDTMFQAAFGEAISKSNLKSRTLLTIKNPLLSDETPLDRAELWFTP